MKNSKILIIGAHLDDIEIGIGGFLSTLNTLQTNNIITYTVCNGLKVKDNARINTFITNMKTLGITENIIDNYLDTTININVINNIKESISNLINLNKIETVFVVNADTHTDHTLIFEATKLCARQQRTSVKRLYSYQVYTNLNFEQFNCTLPFDTNIKYKLIKNYNQNNNIKLIKSQDIVFGEMIQKSKAEKVRVIFDTI